MHLYFDWTVVFCLFFPVGEGNDRGFTRFLMVFNFLLIYGVVVMVESVKSLLTQSDVLVHSLFF